MSQKEVQPLSMRLYLAALGRTLKMAFVASPSAVFLRLADIIVGAIIPLVLTILAALTTTQLVEAFNGVHGADQATVGLVVATSIVGLLQILWTNVSSYVDKVIRWKVQLGVSTRMYERFVRLDFWRYDDKATIDTFDKATRFSDFFSFVFTSLGRIASDIIAVIVSIVALLYISPWISLVMLIAIIPGAIVQIRIARKQATHWSNTVKPRREASYIEYNLLRPESIAELRIYKLATYMLNRRKSLMEESEKGILDIERKYIIWQFGANTILSVAEIISLVWIVVLIATRQQPVGQFIFVQQMVSRALSSATGIAMSLGRLDEDLANLTDYDKFMNMPLQQLQSKRIDIVNEIAVRNMSFTYAGSSRKSLNDISLTIPAGQHVAIVGENGAGKTTFIKLLLGLYEPSTGDVLINNAPLRTYNIESWHDMLAVLQQDFVQYYNVSIKKNISYGNLAKKQTDHNVKTAADKAESSSFIDQLSKKYDTMAQSWFTEDDEEAAMLSGGQWQRVALARNFYRDAPIIILDEPTSAIDALAEAKIFKKLLSKDNKKTIITISHRLTTVEKADIIYVFKDGQIAEQGSHKELVAINGEYARMFEDQIRHDK